MYQQVTYIEYFPFLSVLSILVIALVLATFLILMNRRRKRLIQVLQRIAEKRGGEVTKYPIIYPSLQFNHDGAKLAIRFEPGSRHSPPKTTLYVFHDFSLNHEVIVYRETTLSRIAKAFGMKDIQMGSEEFDNKFIVKGDDEYFTYNLLDYEIQEKLIGIWHLAPHIYLSQNLIDITVLGLLEKEEDYDMMIDLAIALLSRIKELGQTFTTS